MAESRFPARIDPDAFDATAEILPQLGEALLIDRGDAASEIDVMLVEQIINLSGMLRDAAAERRKLAEWVEMFATIATFCGMVEIDPDLDHLNPEFAKDVATTAADVIAWNDGE